MKLSELFGDDNIAVGVEPADKETLLESIVADLDAKGFIKDRQQVVRDVIDHGVAIPHAYTDGVEKLVAGFYRTDGRVDFEALDENGVDLFFIILGPKESRRNHIKVLAKISRLLNHEDFREDLRKAADVKAVQNVFKKFGDK
jgi:mannitol/fructose-specific phosphotransferase system IIA component (Ntr-type)